MPWSFANDANILVQEQFEGGDWLWDTFYSDLSAEERAKRGGGFFWPESMANHPNNVEALQMLQDLAFVDNASYMSDFGDILDAFESGRIGMIPAHRAWVSRFNAAGLGPDDFDVVFMPRWKTQKHQYGASALAITTLSQHPEEAWELLKYMTSHDVQYAYVAGGVHGATRRSVMDDPAQHEGIGPNNWQAWYDMLDETDAAPIPAPAQNKDFTIALTSWIGLAMANELSAQEALDGMHNDLNMILGVS